jgi:hypothetical protein
MLGGVRVGVTVKFVAEEPGPSTLVTVIGPVVAPAGTVAVIWTSESIVNEGAAVPLNATSVAPVKLVPVMTTAVPTGPEVGLNESTVGATAEAGRAVSTDSMRTRETTIVTLRTGTSWRADGRRLANVSAAGNP